MRQAGRYLPGYMEIKGGKGVLEVAKTPELASAAAVAPVELLGVDAAILYSDIMLPMEAVGVKLEIRENVGPVILEPIRSLGQIEALGRLDPASSMPFLGDVIGLTLQKLNDRVPLIGFSGAPFTLAAYLLEGGPSRDLHRTKVVMHSEPDLWEGLMGRLTEIVSAYLNIQVRRGVAAVQLFDSWVGCLSAADYRKHVLRFTKDVFDSVQSIPKIHFCADSSPLIEAFHETGPDVLSVDWRVPIGQVWRRCNEDTAVQGNLDPVAAQVGGGTMEDATAEVLEGAKGHSGHIFSLGHGVQPQTEPANLIRLVERVHRLTRRRQ